MAERTRDDDGRPRNSRPRDALGRPLPPGSEGVPRIPDELRLTAPGYLAYAQDLLDKGLAFNAHEVLEAAWKERPQDERSLWQGLAQLAVGVTHIQRGNMPGAAALLHRGCAGLAEVARPAPHSVDADGLIAWATDMAGEAAVTTEIAPERLRPRLTRG
ncbi:DUF309 domain-containing protein [Mycolicibacterium gilvum]|uniref:Domain of uncharacterized function (DUF309) n=2 Tax=Mycolicibacterium gilvum TaxID=1804 RepID=A0A378SWV0_9MYCO|nr:DUF309 domain-containing protein [Mycolicibacterium gilvum]ABP43448.1 protein of unknown function DUF309 [Mycolicibacterium gilvum PYR-GCK]MCV7054069.1 DUF309 domain-containing protein [Mycolicibacterium gilvum]STZ46334.1 Domain of uncharacterised function (DUF309) [Mycolicibacterium gilvum]